MTRFQSRRCVFGLAAAFAITGCSDGTGPSSGGGLQFNVSPASTSVGTVLAPAVVVAARDEDGHTRVDWTGTVRLELTGGSPTAELEGTRVRDPEAGLAIFDDMVVTEPGTGFRLVARAAGMEDIVSAPFDIHTIFQAATISAGFGHTCALTADGTAFCWGDGGAGQLGTGGTARRTIPGRVATTVRFSDIVAYGTHTCARSLDGGVYCWGSNHYGQLGDGTRDNRSTPQRVELPGPAVMMDTGDLHSCALMENGAAWCWGDNGSGALGIGVADSVRTTPVQVVGGHEWAKIETGYMQTCGLTTEGVVYCWGPDYYGENGTGEYAPLTAPTTPVAGSHTFTDVVAGGGPCHGESCGITADGRVLCWGKNYQRTLGPTSAPTWGVPTALAEDPGLESVTIGPNMICGFTDSGELYCLGDASYGTMQATEAPAPMAPDLGPGVLAAGNTHVCIIAADGRAYCWGHNNAGQLGSGGVSLGWSEPHGVWAPDGSALDRQAPNR